MRLRIDELAQRAGTTSRNIRAYQERGLLAPPELEGRTGYYGEEHLRRLELIGRLQERGFSLEAIRHTLTVWARGGDLSSLIGIENLLDAPVATEDPREYAREELVERFPEMAEEPGLLLRALELGLLEAVDDDRFRAPSPVLIEAGTELARVGVPLEAVFELVRSIRPDVVDIARRFVDLVRGYVVEPLLVGSPDPHEVGATIEAIHRLRPLALEVVRPFLARALEDAIRDAVQDLAAGAGDGDGELAG
ncbi:MAG: MerR family transcriptional regulator [Actinobacteria bacterium]|nr:MerR family transcriptional regulator [Actinomycetota bacterium]